MAINLSKSKYYSQFVYDRDMALDRLLMNSRLRQADMIDRSMTQVLDRINHRYAGLSILNPKSISQLDEELDHIMKSLAVQLFHEVMELRKKSYMLAHLGEAQAISGAANMIPKFKADQSTLDDLRNHPWQAGSVLEVIAQNLNAVRRKVITKVEECLLGDAPVSDALFYSFKQFPRKKPIPTKAPLKKVKPREANTKPKFSVTNEVDGAVLDVGQGNFSPFVWDQVTWNKLLEDYQKEYIKIDRSPAAVYSLKDPLTDDPVKFVDGIYAWEVEQETTHDFVQQVRAGQIAAATAQGIEDFIVITVIDATTCESCCDDFGCIDFDGLKVSEIMEMTKNNYSTPPFHFNCRCTLAPISEADEASLGDLSEYGEWVADAKDFDTWLNS